MRRSSAQTRAGHCNRAPFGLLQSSAENHLAAALKQLTLQLSLFFHAAMSDIVSAEAAAQEGEALLPSAELAKNLGLTLAASVVLTFSTIVYMQGGLHPERVHCPVVPARSTSTADESFSIFAACARTSSSSEGSAARLRNAAINIELDCRGSA